MSIEYDMMCEYLRKHRPGEMTELYVERDTFDALVKELGVRATHYQGRENAIHFASGVIFTTELAK